MIDIAALAHLAGWVKSTTLQDFHTVPTRLVFEHAHKLRPSAISYCLGKMAILEHTRHVQILNRYHLVLVDKLLRGLVQEITTLVCYVAMALGNFLTLPFVTIGILLLSRKSTLFLGEFSLSFPVIGWVLYPLTIGGHEEVVYPNVNTYRLSWLMCFRRLLDAIITEERNPVVPASVTRNGYALDFTDHLTVLHELDRVNLGELHVIAGHFQQKGGSCGSSPYLKVGVSPQQNLMTDFIPTAFVTGIIAVVCLVVTLLVLVAMYFVKRNGTTTTISLDDDGVKQVVETKPAEWSRQRIVYTIALAVNIASLASIIAMAFIYSQGAQRGMTMDDWKAMNLDEVIAANDRTPVSQTLPSDRNGDIVILYKYNCPDCEAIYDQLDDAIRDTGAKDVYFVASSSETGQDLIEEGDIQTAPTGIYLRHEALNNGTAITHIPLATSNGNETVLDTTALKRLVLLQSNEK